jgi:hypothetical protein
MTASAAEFEGWLEGYENDPGQSSNALRKLSMGDSATFLQYAQAAILNRPISPALRFLAGVSVNAGIVKVVLGLFRHSRQQGVVLAKKIMQCEPRFDLAIAEVSRAEDESTLQTVLDVLEVISENDRVVPAALRLLRHPNPRIRSKAALFAALRLPAGTATSADRKGIDGRVRANILENLYGINSETVANIFRSYVHDENNRAAGNAILGLYQLGEADSIPLIYEAARYAQARFRNTCAWLIGRTADPRFAPLVAELMQDDDRVVQAQSIRALGELKRTGRASRQPLRVSVVRLRGAVSHKDLIATVHDEAGQPVRRIAATGFTAREGGPSQTVRNYTVSEYECQESLKIAFIFCLPSSAEGALDSECGAAVEFCAGLRRPKDRWAIAKVSGKTGAARPTEIKFEYSLLPTRITGMLGDTPQALGDQSDAADGARAVLDALLEDTQDSLHPHLVFFGADPQPDLVRALLELKDDLKATIHVLACFETWGSRDIQELTHSKGGCFQRITASNTLKSACFTTFSSLLHHYRLSWTDALVPTDLEVNAASGRGSATYESTLEKAAVLVGGTSLTGLGASISSPRLPTEIMPITDVVSARKA